MTKKSVAGIVIGIAAIAMFFAFAKSGPDAPAISEQTAAVEEAVPEVAKGLVAAWSVTTVDAPAVPKPRDHAFVKKDGMLQADGVKITALD